MFLFQACKRGNSEVPFFLLLEHLLFWPLFKYCSVLYKAENAHSSGLTHITNELSLSNIRDYIFLLLLCEVLFDHCSLHKSLIPPRSLGPGAAQQQKHTGVSESPVMVNATPAELIRKQLEEGQDGKAWQNK